ncbi:hypothetical protein P9112_007669 [Eukaryota sp. TZLM1-RC]
MCSPLNLTVIKRYDKKAQRVLFTLSVFHYQYNSNYDPKTDPKENCWQKRSAIGTQMAQLFIYERKSPHAPKHAFIIMEVMNEDWKPIAEPIEPSRGFQRASPTTLTYYSVTGNRRLISTKDNIVSMDSLYEMLTTLVQEAPSSEIQPSPASRITKNPVQRQLSWQSFSPRAGSPTILQVKEEVPKKDVSMEVFTENNNPKMDDLDEDSMVFKSIVLNTDFMESFISLMEKF